MRVFYTIHPTDAVEDSLHANCEQCGVFVDLEIDYFRADENDIAKAMNAFEREHVCSEADLFGFIEYYDEKKVADYYGLPHIL